MCLNRLKDYFERKNMELGYNAVPDWGSLEPFRHFFPLANGTQAE
jgi:hypothetical protein